MRYRVLVTISRAWGRWDIPIREFRLIDAAHRGVLLVHGGAPHGDRDLARIAHSLFGWPEEVHPALWRPNGIYNPQAGLLRNRVMVERGADECLAFIRDGSRGATHCAGLAEEAGIPVRRFRA